MRDYKIIKYMNNTHYTIIVVDSYGQEHTSFFRTVDECSNYAYEVWANEVKQPEDLLSKAEVIDPSKLTGKDIKFGAKVLLIDLDTDEEANYQIVGDIESDFKEKKISISSPIAKALIGKSVGDEVDVNTPGGGKSYEIIKVSYN